MVGSVDHVDYRDTELDASSSGRRDLSLSMVCNISRSPSTSVEQENDTCWSKMGSEIGDVVRGIVGFNLLWNERGNNVGYVFLWQNGARMGSGHITCWWWGHLPLFTWE